MFRVLADVVYYLHGRPDTPSRALAYKGAVLPADVLASNVSFLLGAGMVAEVDDPVDDPAPAPVPSASAKELQALASQVATAQTTAQQAQSQIQNLTTAAQQAISSGATDRTSMRQWLASLQAQVDGLQLAAGLQGERGVQGERGLQGERGPTGVAGAAGATGPAGPGVEMRTNAGVVQWRQVGAATWTDLFVLPTSRLQSASTPLIVNNQSADITVTWKTPMPSAAYTVAPIRGHGLLSLADSALVVKSQTAAGCVVTVTAVAGSVSAGSTLFVHARNS